MKTILDILKICVILIFILFSTCKSKTDIIVGEWEIESSFLNGSKDLIDNNFIWIIMENNSFKQIIKSPYHNEEVEGTWRFDSKSGTVRFIYSNTGVEVEWRIVKLEKGIMELNHTTPGFFVERRFVKQN